jgi:OFA family oxalate/formate antiporter-like MFS transporter
MPDLSRRIFRGWIVVAAAFTVLFVVYGIQFSFGTFVTDIVDDTGWSESRLQLIFATYIFGYSALSAVSGTLTDRLGPQIVVASGSIVLLAGYLVWASASNLWIVFLGIVGAM